MKLLFNFHIDTFDWTSPPSDTSVDNDLIFKSCNYPNNEINKNYNNNGHNGHFNNVPTGSSLICNKTTALQPSFPLPLKNSNHAAVHIPTTNSSLKIVNWTESISPSSPHYSHSTENSVYYNKNECFSYR